MFDEPTNSLTVNLEQSVNEKSDCESSEWSIVGFNSTESSFLENVDNYVLETMKIKEEIDIIQWLAYSLPKAWSVNYVIHQL